MAAETVLIIDDEEAVRRAFGRLLQRAGYEILFAEDGVDGLAKIRETNPGAVLLDLNMPGLSGLQVLAECSRTSPETPVIVISGTGVIENVVQALRCGAWDYVTKPVEDVQLLVQAVIRALERSTLVRENRAQRAHLERLNVRLTEAVEELRADQEAGKRVQFQLLPPDRLRIGAYEFTRRLYPSQYLSGDFIDYFPAGEHHAAMYLADVSGHGAASAFVTAMLATLIGRYREALTRGESDVVLWPDRLLENLNRDLGLQKLRKHVTMFYCVVDLRTNRLSFSSAGQYPFPLLDDGDRVHVLECSGRPLGLFADARFSRRDVSLDATRRVLLLSDGVLELLEEPPGERKIDRLVRSFRASDDMDAIVAAFGIDAQARPRDDVALLLVEKGAAHG
ncbi:MAG TPA: SpoIIE family protein phosphatase [Polyangiaceae bacterium]|nr:SpoIIE family protein phosphatase [Polyangiaceae bacterium]